MMDVNEIRKYLPHRYPFLLVDRVVELTPGESIVAYKNVTVNEPFFNGHFPDHPVMPGVLIVEAMAQAAGILGFKTMDKRLRMVQSTILWVLITFVLNAQLFLVIAFSLKHLFCLKNAVSGSSRLKRLLKVRPLVLQPFFVLIGRSDFDSPASDYRSLR